MYDLLPDNVAQKQDDERAHSPGSSSPAVDPFQRNEGKSEASEALQLYDPFRVPYTQLLEAGSSRHLW